MDTLKDLLGLFLVFEIFIIMVIISQCIFG